MNNRRAHAHIFDNLHYAVDKLSDSNANNLVTIGQKPEFFCFTSGGRLVPIPLELLNRVPLAERRRRLMPGMVGVRLPYRRLQKNVFSHLEEDQVTLKGKLTSIASDGLQFVPCPLAPVSEDDLNKIATSTSWVNLSPGQMYLSRAVPAHRQRKSPQLKYATQRGEFVTVLSDKLALAGVAARCFVYLGGSVSQIVKWYNMSLAICGLLKAAFARSPFLCGHPMPQQAMETIMHCDGLDSFRASQKDSGLCPFDGVGYLNSRTPQLNVMLYYGSMINSRPFLLETYTDRGPYGAMKAWLSHNWTCAAGILLDEEEDHVWLKLELRFLPSGSPKENTLNSYILACAIIGLADQVKPEDVCSYEDARTNFFTAVQQGVFGEFQLFGKQHNFMNSWDSIILPAIRHGEKLLHLNGTSRYYKQAEELRFEDRASSIRSLVESDSPDDSLSKEFQLQQLLYHNNLLLEEFDEF